ncbi:MAG: lipopolysaccharide transport periplasmic protein LptA [Gammaproteobacteria bacterium]|nr:lipopolysaccharide transport periplasmic protein LptA [Gammaproteobacteria bacterium]
MTTLDKHADTGRTTYSGHVVITRGPVVIRGVRAIVFTLHQRVEKAVVTGSLAVFVWKPEDGPAVHGEAQTITWLAVDNALLLETDAKLRRGEQIFSAAQVRYDLDTRTVRARGGEGQRVHVVIPPAKGTAAKPEASR